MSMTVHIYNANPLHSNNRFKGIAFIEYELPEEADRAVAGGNNLEIGGQKVSTHPKGFTPTFTDSSFICLSRLWLPFPIHRPS